MRSGGGSAGRGVARGASGGDKYYSAAMDLFDGLEAGGMRWQQLAPGAMLSLHQDRDEQDLGQPIGSVSLGLPAVFLLPDFPPGALSRCLCGAGASREAGRPCPCLAWRPGQAAFFAGDAATAGGAAWPLAWAVAAGLVAARDPICSSIWVSSALGVSQPGGVAKSRGCSAR